MGSIRKRYVKGFIAMTKDEFMSENLYMRECSVHCPRIDRVVVRVIVGVDFQEGKVYVCEAISMNISGRRLLSLEDKTYYP